MLTSATTPERPSIRMGSPITLVPSPPFQHDDSDEKYQGVIKTTTIAAIIEGKNLEKVSVTEVNK